MNKIKQLLVGFVKPLILAHVQDLDKLTPLLAKVLVEKSHMSQDQADSLAVDLIGVVETEIAVLINKI